MEHPSTGEFAGLDEDGNRTYNHPPHATADIPYIEEDDDPTIVIAPGHVLAKLSTIHRFLAHYEGHTVFSTPEHFEASLTQMQMAMEQELMRDQGLSVEYAKEMVRQELNVCIVFSFVYFDAFRWFLMIAAVARWFWLVESYFPLVLAISRWV